MPCTVPQGAQHTEMDTVSRDHPIIQAKWEIAWDELWTDSVTGPLVTWLGQHKECSLNRIAQVQTLKIYGWGWQAHLCREAAGSLRSPRNWSWRSFLSPPLVTSQRLEAAVIWLMVAGLVHTDQASCLEAVFSPWTFAAINPSQGPEKHISSGKKWWMRIWKMPLMVI